MGYKVMKAASVYEPEKILTEEVEEEAAPRTPSGFEKQPLRLILSENPEPKAQMMRPSPLRGSRSCVHPGLIPSMTGERMRLWTMH